VLATRLKAFHFLVERLKRGDQAGAVGAGVGEFGAGFTQFDGARAASPN
jgi:hypothetical protein